MNTIRIKTLDATRLTCDDAQAVAALLVQIWPREEMTLDAVVENLRSQWCDYTGPVEQTPRYLTIRPDSTVMAMAQVQPRTIGTIAGEITVLALARVCVDPARRGEGLGAAVVRAAFSLVDAGDFPFALFQTTPPVQAFYEKLGASVIDNKIINATSNDPDTCPFWEDVLFRYPNRPGWPTGTIDLQGPGY